MSQTVFLCAEEGLRRTSDEPERPLGEGSGETGLRKSTSTARNITAIIPEETGDARNYNFCLDTTSMSYEKLVEVVTNFIQIYQK